MEAQRASPAPTAPHGDFTLWWQWVLASVVGGALGWALAEELTLVASFHVLWPALDAAFGGDGPSFAALLAGGLVSGAIAGGVIGSAVGAAQCLPLRRRIPAAAWWILVCCVGRLLATPVNEVTYEAMVWSQFRAPGPPGLTEQSATMLRRLDLGSVVLGASLVALVQWRFLRRHVRRAVWWIPTCVVGEVMRNDIHTSIFGMVFAHTERPSTPYGADPGWVTGDALGAAAGWGAYGILTGLVLVWLLSHPARPPVLIPAYEPGPGPG